MRARSYLLSVFFMLGWRFCGFWSSYPDHEVSTNSYLLHAHSHIRTWSNFPVKLEQIYIIIHVLSFLWTWFFELGWRLIRFVAAYLDGEMSAGSYLLSVHSHIRTWRIFPVKLEQIYIIIHVISFLWTGGNFTANWGQNHIPLRG